MTLLEEQLKHERERVQRLVQEKRTTEEQLQVSNLLKWLVKNGLLGQSMVVQDDLQTESEMREKGAADVKNAREKLRQLQTQLDRERANAADAKDYAARQQNLLEAAHAEALGVVQRTVVSTERELERCKSQLDNEVAMTTSLKAELRAEQDELTALAKRYEDLSRLRPFASTGPPPKLFGLHRPSTQTIWPPPALHPN